MLHNPVRDLICLPSPVHVIGRQVDALFRSPQGAQETLTISISSRTNSTLSAECVPLFPLTNLTCDLVGYAQQLVRYGTSQCVTLGVRRHEPNKERQAGMEAAASRGEGRGRKGWGQSQCMPQVKAGCGGSVM